MGKGGRPVAAERNRRRETRVLGAIFTELTAEPLAERMRGAHHSFRSTPDAVRSAPSASVPPLHTVPADELHQRDGPEPTAC